MLYREITPYERIASKNPTITTKKIKLLSPQLVVLYTVAFFVARVFMLKAMMPFGIAFFVAVYGFLNMETTVLTGIIIMLGYASSMNGYISGVHIVIMLLLFVFMLFLKNSDKNRILKMSLLSFASVLGVSMILDYTIISRGFIMFNFIIALLEATVVMASIYIFSYGMPIYFQSSKKRSLSKEELVCLGFIAAAGISGMAGIGYHGISMRNMFIYFMVLCAGYIEGPALGSAFGITLGMTCGLSDPAMSINIGCYGFCGLVGGIFRNLGKAISAIAFVLAFVISSIYTGNFHNMVNNLIEMILPLLIFLIIPESRYAKLSGTFEAVNKDAELETTYIEKTKDLMNRKFSALTKTLAGLSEVLSQNIDNELSHRAEINGMVEKLADRVCGGCDSKALCWQKDFYYSFDSFNELLRSIEKLGRIGFDDMPRSLKNRCIRPNELIKQSNYIYEIFKLNNKWRKKLINSKIIVSEQVKGITEIMKSMTDEIFASIDFRSDVEDQIAVAFDRNGLEFEDILAIKNGKGKYEVTVYKKPCQGKQECKRNFETIISRSLGLKMSRESGKCKLNNDCSICQFRFIEAENYNVVTAVSKASKEDVSGDNYSYGSINDGRYMLALSDGMGSGVRAAIESNTTISLLEKFIEAGFERSTAIKAINSVLVLRSNDESFATIDLGVIDLHNGMGEFVKIGSAPTYIKSGMEVEVLKSTSIPVGILDEIDIESQIVSLKNGDMIVMVTDGVIDASKDKNEKWITKSLKELDSGNPKDVAEYLLNKAKEQYGGNIGDDMTIIVSKIWKVV